MADPITKYARSDGVAIAWQELGEGPPVIFVPGFASHIELNWEVPWYSHLLQRIARSCHLVVFDKRGTGLSDRGLGLGTLEVRMDDVRAVMDAAGLERASLFGVSEGVPMSLLFAATYPERVTSLVLYGGFARIARSDDYPIGMPLHVIDPYLDSIEAGWGTGRVWGQFVQNVPADPGAIDMMARFERYACTPPVAREIMRRNLEIDVRAALPAIKVPTLIMHTTGDPVTNVRWGRYMAEHLPDSRYLEIPGNFHATWTEDGLDELTGPLVEFVTGTRQEAEIDRVLATVLFTDIVGSTATAARLGDHGWKQLLDEHDRVTREEVARHRGRTVNSTGDGFLCSFDGPVRAIRCAFSIAERVRALGLDVRAGVHTGECEVRGDDLAGMAVHIGARVAALADAGEVLVSQVVRDLVVGSGIEFDDRGVHQLKGVPGSWTVLAAHPPVAAVSR